MSGERRLWDIQTHRWVMAPADIEAGQPFEWAGHHCIAVSIEGSLRYREIKYVLPASKEVA